MPGTGAGDGPAGGGGPDPGEEAPPDERRKLPARPAPGWFQRRRNPSGALPRLPGRVGAALPGGWPPRQQPARGPAHTPRPLCGRTPRGGSRRGHPSASCVSPLRARARGRLAFAYASSRVTRTPRRPWPRLRASGSSQSSCAAPHWMVLSLHPRSLMHVEKVPSVTLDDAAGACVHLPHAGSSTTSSTSSVTPARRVLLAHALLDVTEAERLPFVLLTLPTEQRDGMPLDESGQVGHARGSWRKPQETSAAFIIRSWGVPSLTPSLSLYIVISSRLPRLLRRVAGGADKGGGTSEGESAPGSSLPTQR